MEEELVAVTEQVRLTGLIPGDMNATFLVLIMKAPVPELFSNYRPISLCNVIYKISSKSIANRIKGFLNEAIFREQYGFLKGRSIHNVVAIAQEVMHSIHTKKWRR